MKSDINSRLELSGCTFNDIVCANLVQEWLGCLKDLRSQEPVGKKGCWVFSCFFSHLCTKNSIFIDFINEMQYQNSEVVT